MKISKAIRGLPCPVKGCTAHAKPQQLMCWPHWRRVPKALNQAVFDTHRSWQREPNAENRRNYEAAAGAAILMVEAKEAPDAE